MLACSCTPTASDYSSFIDLPERGWAYGDTVTFPVSADSIKPRSLSVAIRHNDDYEYRNLWLEVSYTDADSIQRRDTVSMELADVYGHWLGHGLGTSYQMQTKVSDSVNLLPQSHVQIRHVMRTDTLRGLRQIGVETAP